MQFNWSSPRFKRGLLPMILTMMYLGPITAIAQQCEWWLVKGGMVHDGQGNPVLVEGKKGVLVPVFSSVNRENIRQIFRHRYDSQNPRKFGAKAVAAVDIMSRPLVWYFPTGEGQQGSNVHHRDALSALLELLWSKVGRLERMVDNSILNLTDGDEELLAQIKPGYRTAEDVYRTHEFLDLTLEIARGIKNRWLENADSVYFRHLMGSVQGFQMTAEEIDGELTITEIKTDSSITAFQKRFGLWDDFNVQPKLRDATLKGIGKKVRAVDRIDAP